MNAHWDRDGMTAAARACQRTHGIPALALALYRTDGAACVYHGADPDGRQAIDAASMFNIGSVGKPLTALAVMRLIEEKRIAPDAPFVTLLPAALARAAPPALRAVTVMDLVTHRSGLPFWTCFDSEAAFPLLASTFADIRLADVPRPVPKYSNLGYFLLGCIIEHVTRVPFETCLHDDVLAPLGMAGARFGPRRALQRAGHPVVAGYTSARMLDFPTAGTPLVEAPDCKLPPAFSGLYASTGDMLCWMRAFLNDGAGPRPEALARAIAHVVGRDATIDAGQRLVLGAGMRLQRIFGHAAATHLGYALGYSAYLMFFPGMGIAGMAMCNRSGCQIPLTKLLHLVMAHCLNGKRLDTAPPRLKLDYSHYCGTYTGRRGTLRVFPGADDSLFMATPAGTLELTALNRTHFMPQSGLRHLPTFTLESGRARKCRIGSDVYAKDGVGAPDGGAGRFDAYLGEYVNAISGEMVIYADEDELHMTQGVEDALLTPLGDDAFRIGEVAFFTGEELRFSRGPNGAVQSCAIGNLRFDIGRRHESDPAPAHDLEADHFDLL